MGGGEKSVKRATVKKASIRNNLRFQCGMVVNNTRGHAEGIKRSAGMADMGSIAEWQLFLRQRPKRTLPGA